MTSIYIGTDCSNALCTCQSAHPLIFLNFSSPCTHILLRHYLSLYMSFSFAWSSVKPQSCWSDGAHHEGCVCDAVSTGTYSHLRFPVACAPFLKTWLFIITFSAFFLGGGGSQNCEVRPVSFVMSVWPPTHPSAWKNSSPTWRIFTKFGILVFFSKNLSRKFDFH